MLNVTVILIRRIFSSLVIHVVPDAQTYLYFVTFVLLLEALISVRLNVSPAV